MVPRRGFEPPTNGLGIRCSIHSELPGHASFKERPALSPLSQSTPCHNLLQFRDLHPAWRACTRRRTAARRSKEKDLAWRTTRWREGLFGDYPGKSARARVAPQLAATAAPVCVRRCRRGREVWPARPGIRAQWCPNIPPPIPAAAERTLLGTCGDTPRSAQPRLSLILSTSSARRVGLGPRRRIIGSLPRSPRS